MKFMIRGRGFFTGLLGLYVMTRVSDIKFEDLVVAVAPFLIPMIIVLFIITYVPQIVLLIPNLFMGK